MTPLAIAVLVLAVFALLVGYLVVCLLVIAVRALNQLPTRPRPSPPARDVVDPPRWTALDDQQLARYLKQPPP
jgi:hypothetical protein